VDQRRLLSITQALGFAASLTLGVLVATGDVELWHIYMQVALQSGIGAVDGAGRQALFPRLVPRSLIAEAVTLSVAAGRLSALIGPLVGGFIIAVLTRAAPFMLNAATFLILIAAITGMRGAASTPGPSGSSFRGELFAGLRHIMAAPVLSGLLRMEIVFSVFQMNAVMITIIAREVLVVGPQGLGGLLAAPASGAILGLAGLLVVGHARRPGRFIVMCTIAYSLTLVAFASGQSYEVAFGALVLLGLLDSLVMATRHTVMQLAAPETMRGRVMANMGTVTRGFGPLAQTQSGILAGLIGPPLAVVVAAASLAVAAVNTARTNPALWEFHGGTRAGNDDVIGPSGG
jgi:hypothetical protein